MSPDNKEPLASAVLPVFNADKNFGKCLESEINQTYLNWKCVFHYDYGINGTLEDANSYDLSQKKIDFFPNETFIKMNHNRNTECINLNLNKKSPSIINIFS